MSILQKLDTLFKQGQPLIITSDEYQLLCKEVFELGAAASDYDSLILDYKYNYQNVIVTEI